MKTVLVAISEGVVLVAALAAILTLFMILGA